MTHEFGKTQKLRNARRVLSPLIQKGRLYVAWDDDDNDDDNGGDGGGSDGDGGGDDNDYDDDDTHTKFDEFLQVLLTLHYVPKFNEKVTNFWLSQVILFRSIAKECRGQPTC